MEVTSAGTSVLETVTANMTSNFTIQATHAPPPNALWGWPGCAPPDPLPAPGPFGVAYFYVWRILPPLYIVFGTFGNVVTSLVIFRGFRKITSTSVLLLALAVSDTIFLFCPPLRNWVLYTWKVDIFGFTNIGCKLGSFATYCSYQASSWLLVALTVERVICIMWPHKVKVYCTPKNATIAVCVIVFLICGSNAHIPYGVGNTPLDIYPDTKDCYVASEDYFDFYEYYLHWIHFAFGFLIPCVLIVLGNNLIIWGLRRLNKREKWMVSSSEREGHAKSSTRSSKQRRSVTVMLISLNVLFFVSQTPLSVMLICLPYLTANINKFACSDFTHYMTRAEILKLIDAVCLNLAFLNSSCNFVLYVISGSRFRSEVRALMTCTPRAHGKTVFTSTRAGSARERSSMNDVNSE